MNFEPDKKHFFAVLKAADFNPSNLLKNPQSLQEILWYFDEDRIKEIAKEILSPEKNSRDDAEQIITNLAKLYPLSKFLVMEIMSSLRKPNYSDGKPLYCDAEFLDGFDVGKTMHAEITATFNEVESRIIRLTKEVKEYKNSLESLKANKNELQRQSAALREVANERDNLRAQIEQLRIDADENRLKQQMDELKAEKNQLEAAISGHKLRVSQYEKNIRDIKAELKDWEQRPQYAAEVRALKELFKKFPNDAEDKK